MLRDFWNRLGETAEDRFYGLAEALVRYGIRILIAFLIVWISIKIGRRVQRLAMRKWPLARERSPYQAFFARGAFLGTVAIGILIALGAMGVDQTALAALTGAGVVALTVAMQDVLKNYAAGVYLLVERPFSVGDRIRISGEEGIVSEIGVRTTVIRNDHGQDVLVPNYSFFSVPMVDLRATQPPPENDTQI